MKKRMNKKVVCNRTILRLNPDRMKPYYLFTGSSVTAGLKDKKHFGPVDQYQHVIVSFG